jgi:hypothetical protein
MDLLAKRYGRWYVESLPPILDKFARHRNPASHGSRTDRKTAIALRDEILGIGRYGLLEEMAGCWGHAGKS